MDDTKLLLLADKFRRLRDRVDGLSVKQEEIQTIKGDQGPKGEQGDRGFDGAPGKDGDDGADGTDGQDGKDGISVVKAEIAFDGSLVLYLSDGREIDCGEVVKETSDKVLQTLKQGSSARLEDIQNILFTNVTNGDILTYESSSGLWKNKQPSPKITVSATQPSSPTTGDIWFDIS
jgi:hypothetical protein